MGSVKHFVLVHGGGHGAWCWYKIVPLLKSAGHRVTALDLGACGVNPKPLDEITSFSDYVQPLTDFMASLPQDERVILVGHSFGGFGISVAMENFPEKISVAVFLAAYMPNYTSPPASLLQEFFKRTPVGSPGLSDCRFEFRRGPENPPTSATFGPDHIALMYKNCPEEDVELAKALVRPAGVFTEDLSKESMLTEDKYGSVRRVYVVTEADAVMKEDFQLWIIENSPTKNVKSISEADHMAMLSKPKQVFQCLQEIAEECYYRESLVPIIFSSLVGPKLRKTK